MSNRGCLDIDVEAFERYGQSCYHCGMGIRGEFAGIVETYYHCKVCSEHYWLRRWFDPRDDSEFLDGHWLVIEKPGILLVEDV